MTAETRLIVMRGLDPRIHVFLSAPQGVDGRVEPGHDDMERSTRSLPVIASAAKQSRSSSRQVKDWIASSLRSSQ
jgi:hypothetical protein